MGDVELVGLYWTLSGPVDVHVGREWSLFAFEDRCAEAAKVGFDGIGIWHADLAHLLETHSLPDLKAILDGAGLKHLELEFLMDWFVDPGDERRAASDEQRRLLFDAAAVLEPHHIKIGNIPATPAPLEQVTERFAELCADAAEHHAATIAYEIMPFDPNVPPVVPPSASSAERKAACDAYTSQSPITYVGNPFQITAPLRGYVYGFAKFVSVTPPANYDGFRIDTPTNLKVVREIFFTVEGPTVDPLNRGPLFLISQMTQGGVDVVHFDLKSPDPMGTATGTAALLTDLDEDPVQF